MPIQLPAGLVFFPYFFRFFSYFFSASWFGDLLASPLCRGGAGGRLRYYIAVLCLLMDVGKMHKVSGILLMITVVNTSIGRTIGLICL